MSSKYFNEMMEKVDGDRETVGILGLGYVGLPLTVTFAKQGIQVLGFEKSVDKLKRVRAKDNYISDVEDGDLTRVVDDGTLAVTDDFTRISECDAVIICVPTPLDRFKKPDMSYIQSACEEIGANMKPGTLVALESTTYPTTTEEFMLPILERVSGMTHGNGFWLVYSPERVDPGNKTHKIENTPKVVGGMGEEAQAIAMKLYGKAIQQLHPVSSPRIAEMVKILENTYRLVNISLMNEIALLSGKMDIDIWEVIEAAKTKPYGFHAFYPGPGIGGHCIPLDPFYLEHIAKKYAFDLTMIHTAGHIDNLMPHRMSIKITSALNRHKKAVNGSKILFLGVAYKPDIDDERESAALKIIDEIAKKGGEVAYHDPHISEVTTPGGRTLFSQELNVRIVQESDCIVIATKHTVIDFELIARDGSLIVDLQNALGRSSDKVCRL